jgi:hypothetical protein
MERADQKIAKFLQASNEIEQYLHRDGPLTPLEYQTIDTTVMGLQTLLQAWRRKHGKADTLSVMGQITPRNAQES